MRRWLRETFNVRQLLALAVTGVVFVSSTIGIVNIEALLKEKGYDRYLVGNWGHVVGALAAIARILSSDIAIGIAIGALVIAFWNVPLLLARKYLKWPVSTATAHDLDRFFVEYVIPACEAQTFFQEELVRHFCKDEYVADLALAGLRKERDDLKGWRQYEHISLMMDGSPVGDVTYEEISECIFLLEGGGYRDFCIHAHKILDRNGSSINISEHAELQSLWNRASEKHSALVDAYERIKKDKRFKRLYRPKRKSRWL